MSLDDCVRFILYAITKKCESYLLYNSGVVNSLEPSPRESLVDGGVRCKSYSAFGLLINPFHEERWSVSRRQGVITNRSHTEDTKSNSQAAPAPPEDRSGSCTKGEPALPWSCRRGEREACEIRNKTPRVKLLC
eukprot:401951-Pyramimonas_sp.AAC.1